MNFTNAKTAKTRDGRTVVGIQYVPFNSYGGEVTYPIKGSVIIKGKQPSHNIWSVDGKADVVWGKHTQLDLVEIIT